MNYDLLNQDEARSEGKELANKHLEIVKESLTDIKVASSRKVTKRVSDLTIPEFRALWIECYEELERHKYDTAMKEYDRLTTKP